MRPRSDEGNILIAVVLVSMIVGSLAALALSTGTSADWSASSDRNSEVALAVAEAGIHDVVSTIKDQTTAPTGGDPCHAFGLAIGATTPANCFVGSSPQGSYEVRVKRIATGFELDTQGRTGGETLGRARHVRVTLEPPILFSDGGQYALFSEDIVDLKNNHAIEGDVFANATVILDKVTVEGNVTSGLNAIAFRNSQSAVNGNLWSGGYDPSVGKAIVLGGGSVGGWVKASVNAPNCTFEPPSSDANTPSNYRVDLEGGSVAGNVTTRGTVIGGTNYATKTENTCTAAAGHKEMPRFTYNPILYTQVQNFSSVAAFNAIDKSAMQGAYVISQPGATQSTALDLSDATAVGDVTIVTDAPVDVGGMEHAGTSLKTIVIVSRYQTLGDCDDRGGDCAIHAKNDFNVLDGNGNCLSAVLMYAERGAIGMKNTSNTEAMCGSLISQGAITLNNNIDISVAERLKRVTGFGPQAFEITKWEELPVR